MPSDQLRGIVAQMRADPLAKSPTLLDMRAKYEALAGGAALPPDTRSERIHAGTIDAEWLIPTGAEPDRIVLFFHGGGYVIGSIATHRALAARLAHAAQARVLLPEFRRAPEDPYPAAVDDACAMYRWLLAHGARSDRLIVAGDSAGAALAIATQLAARDAKLPLAAAIVGFSPWVDLAISGGSIKSRAAVDPCVTEDSLRDMAAAYLGKNDPRSPLASPLYADLKGLPPLLIQVGTAEVLFDDSDRLAARARAAGVSVELDAWQEMFHVWQAFAPALPEANEALDRAGAFIDRVCRA
jgi:epsilon-lactone hydrolase